MPILSSIAGAAAKAYGMMANAKRIITDSFNRANGSLGTTSSGYLWSVLRGTWSISSNQATSSDSGSTYALATVDVGAQNVIVSADIADGGPGVAFWVTDANSWWASSVNYRTTTTSYTYSGCCGGSISVTPGSSCTCGSYSCTYVKSCYRSVVTGYTNSYSCSGSGIFLSGTDCYYLTYDYDLMAYPYCCPATLTQTPVYGYELCNSVTYPCGYDPGCLGGAQCQTAINSAESASCSSHFRNDCSAAYTNYFTDLKIYRNNSGSISEIASQELNTNTSNFSEVNSVKVVTNGEGITATGYSGSGLSSQLGSSLTYTATGATRGSKAGIIKTPSTSNTGSVVDNFAVENVV